MEKELEVTTNWAVRTRETLLTGEDIRVLPLICEFDGMGGTGKSRLIAELGSHHFHSYGYDPLTFNESNQAVFHIPNNQPKELIEAQFSLTCERLDLAHSLENVRVFVFFDRGIFDFILLYNIAFMAGLITEDKCRDCIRNVITKGGERVDLVFVLTNSVEDSLQEKTVFNSLSFINSLGLHGKNEKETYARFKFAQEVCRRFLINSDKVRSGVKQVVDVNVEEAGKDFDRIFAQVVTILDLHFVFKAWESLFLARFNGELNNLSDKEKISSFAKKLQNPFVNLREKIVKSGEIDPESNVGKVLQSYAKTEFVIGRYKNVRVTMQGIFDSPPKFFVQGL